jgi:proline iminopeptidase
LPSVTRRAALAAAIAAPGLAAAAPRLADGPSRAMLNGVDHWLRIGGAARRTVPLVIVHAGPGGNAYVFERLQGPWLEARRTVVYYDQRGGGRSAAPADPGDYRMETLVADLGALVAHLGPGPVDVLGFSFGAELALEFALAHRGQVRRLILQSPNGGDYVRMAQTETHGLAALASGEEKARLDRLALDPIVSPAARLGGLWRGASPQLWDRFHYHRPDVAAEVRRLETESGFTNTGLMNAVMFSDARPRGALLMERAADLAAPALVIVGAYDRTTGVDVARDLAETLRARLAVFAESAHFPGYEEPPAYAQAVDRFLSP